MLLALLDLRPHSEWSDARDPMLRTVEIMEWLREHYGKDYRPNTRETIRRQTLHQFIDSGLVVINPDDPTRAINSPKSCYGELHALFGGVSAGLVFVSCFPTRAEMRRHLADIAWETDVWCADAPSHLIHFDGERFLGPYPTEL